MAYFGHSAAPKHLAPLAELLRLQVEVVEHELMCVTELPLSHNQVGCVILSSLVYQDAAWNRIYNEHGKIGRGLGKENLPAASTRVRPPEIEALPAYRVAMEGFVAMQVDGDEPAVSEKEPVGGYVLQLRMSPTRVQLNQYA